MWAAPAIAAIEPPPAAADDDAADDATGNADDSAGDPAAAAPAVAETPEATAEPAEAAQAADAAPAAAEAPPADSHPVDAHTAEAPAAHVDAPVAPPSLPVAHAAATDLSAHALRASEAPATPRIGAGLDVGLPDGATASIVVRPIRSLRAHAGVSHNMISLGERVGLTWVPLSWWVSPTLSVEYGHYADGNANPLVRMVSGDRSFSSAVLDRIGYDYANAHAGLEFGRRWFTFYVHAGYSRVTGTVHNLSAETMSESSGTTSVTFSKDPSVRLWAVSARLGFIVYLAK